MSVDITYNKQLLHYLEGSSAMNLGFTGQRILEGGSPRERWTDRGRGSRRAGQRGDAHAIGRACGRSRRLALWRRKGQEKELEEIAASTMFYSLCCTNHHMEGFFVVCTSWWSNLLQISSSKHLINYLAMLIAKPVVWPRTTIL
jgi:hypothetical protein